MMLLTTIPKKQVYNALARKSFNRFKVSLGAATTRSSLAPLVVGLPSNADQMSYYTYYSGTTRQEQHQQTRLSSSSIRFLSTAPPPPKDENDEDEQKGIISRIMSQIVTPRNQFYALAAGGTVGAYIISRGFLAFTSFFTHLHPAFVAKWAFYTGFGCATACSGLAVMTYEQLTIRADPVYKYCLNWVRNDSTVQSAIGDGISPGHLRSYRLDSGKLIMEGRTPVWKPPRIQMIFDVQASGPPYRTGLVTCEAVKNAGFPPRLETTLLKVDYETGNEGEGGEQEGDNTLFLKGDELQLSRVSDRSGLSLNMLGRAVHINKAAAGRC